jgi:hypothetical protein
LRKEFKYQAYVISNKIKEFAADYIEFGLKFPCLFSVYFSFYIIIFSIKNNMSTEDVAQVVELLPGKYRALSSNPTTANKKKDKRKTLTSHRFNNTNEFL